LVKNNTITINYYSIPIILVVGYRQIWHVRCTQGKINSPKPE